MVSSSTLSHGVTGLTPGGEISIRTGMALPCTRSDITEALLKRK